MWLSMETIFVSPFEIKKCNTPAYESYLFKWFIGWLGTCFEVGFAVVVVVFLWAQKGKCNKNDFNLNGCFTLEKFLFFGAGREVKGN